MRNRGMHVLLAVGALGLIATLTVAQTTQPAGGEPAPKLVPIPGVEKSAGGAGAAQPKPETPAVGPPTTQPGPAGRRTGQDGGLGGGMWFYVVLLGGFILLYFWMGRSRRKQESKRKEMLSALKKGDKVVTIGGIMGTIMDARPEEVTVKVDETNNVRMKFARWAVRGVGEEAKQEPPDEKK
ncbi:MAG TPA: preprotein translocase subunit YajC [Phycisphaerae bacterium]|nr:preprotein translocase subunit YajC [Phycisphaerae bacterium]